MSPRASLSHVASPRECDTRQMTSFGATEHATPDATTTRKLPSVRDLARDRLARQASDKELESRATALRQAIHRCCDARGDDDVNRVGLLRECGELPPDGQADMLEHFERETMRYRPRVSTGTLEDLSLEPWAPIEDGETVGSRLRRSQWARNAGKRSRSTRIGRVGSGPSAGTPRRRG